MIAYIINSQSIGNCVDYVTRRTLEEKLADKKKILNLEKKYESCGGRDLTEHLSPDWQLLDHSSDIRVYAGRKAMASDIARPSKSRKPIKNPCGHISLDFHPDDAPSMTDERMAAIARDYISMMGIGNTPYIVVRHNDKKHPHCHLVFSCVDYDGNILKQTSNYKKNERVCKALNEKYSLNIGKNKLQTDITKLRGREKVRYQLAWDILRSLDTGIHGSWEAFRQTLSEKGVGVRIKTSRAGNPNLYFSKEGYEIWGVKIMPVFKVSEIEKYWKVKSERAAKTRKPTSDIPKETSGQSTEKPQRHFVNPDGTYNVRPIEDLLQTQFTEAQLTGYRQGKAVKLEGLTTLPATFLWVKFDKKTSEPRFYKTNPDLTAKPTAKTSKVVPKAANTHEKPTAEPKLPIEIPPLPKGFMDARIVPHELARYQKGEAVCGYICKPDEIVGKHYWIWYDFKTAQPRCESTPPRADRYIPEAFKRQMQESASTSSNLSTRTGITFSATSLGGATVQDEGFAHGEALPDDFKLWLARHPGMTFDEARTRYKEEQKAKQHRNGPKLH